MIEVAGNLHIDLHVLVAPATAVDTGNAAAPETEDRAGLSALGQIILHLSVHGGNDQRSAQRRLGEGNGHLQNDILSVSLEHLVFFYIDGDVQVAGRPAPGTAVTLAPQGDGLSVVDACWYLHPDGAGLADTALTLTGRARFLDDLAGALAVLAGAAAGKDAEGRALGGLHLAGAPAHRTGLGRGALFRAGAAAVLAALISGDADALFTAENRFFKGQLQRDAQVFALPRAVLPGLLTAEATAEHGAEDVAQVEILEASEAAASRAAGVVGVDARKSVLVVAGLFLGVRQHLIGAVDFLHLLFGFFVAGVQIGMVFLRKLAIGLFDFIVAGALLQAQDLIKIALFSHICSPKLQKRCKTAHSGAKLPRLRLFFQKGRIISCPRRPRPCSPRHTRSLRRGRSARRPGRPCRRRERPGGWPGHTSSRPRRRKPSSAPRRQP